MARYQAFVSCVHSPSYTSEHIFITVMISLASWVQKQVSSWLHLDGKPAVFKGLNQLSPHTVDFLE